MGNTARYYAKAFFETLNFDAVTVAPYLGKDGVTPFLDHEGKWVILLALTSNPGSGDFQFLKDNGEELYKTVLKKSQQWGSPENLMCVVGATHPSKFKEIREYAPNNFLLVPGVGAQGGDLAAISQNGMNSDCGLLVNSSRGIIYAGNGEDFAEKAGQEAKKLQQEMAKMLGD